MIQADKKPGILVSFQDTVTGLTPLHLAAMRGEPLVLRTILERGGLQLAEIPDAQGRTPLTLAAPTAKAFLQEASLDCLTQFVYLLRHSVALRLHGPKVSGSI